MDNVLLALSDQSRRTMLEELRRGPATVSELASIVPIARPGVSPAENAITIKEHKLTEHVQSDARPLGTLRFTEGSGTVRMEDIYNTDIDDLWSALVDPSRLAHWIADVTGDLRVGGSFRASFTSGWEGSGRVEVCDAPRRLLVRLDPNGISDVNEMTIEAVLSADGDRTHLVIEDSGFARDELAGHGAGWQAHLEDLTTYLAGQQPSDWSGRWRKWTPAYEALVDALD